MLSGNKKNEDKKIEQTKDNNSVEQANRWVKYDPALHIHKDLFELGVVAVKPTYYQPKESLTNKNSFTLSTRMLFFSKNLEEKKCDFPADPKSIVKARSLLNKLQEFPGQIKYLNDVTDFISKGEILKLKTLASLVCAYADVEDSHRVNGPTEGIFFNPKRREEVFLPILLGGAEAQEFGLYIYPWLSKTNSQFHFSGFTQFASAGCMFGPSLKGMDQHGVTFELIKHDIEFFSEQKIYEIILDTANSYEEMLFDELERLACFIDNLSGSGQKKLFYHLPYYDYMLFGVELYIRGRIMLPALDQFFVAIFNKKDEYIERINKIAVSHGIEVTIESPFDNLFGKLVGHEGVSKEIISILNLSKDEAKLDQLSEKKQKENERDLVQHCLILLLTNLHNKKHQQVWLDFIDAADRNKINNLEDLFKLANAIMVAIPSKEKQKYETCSLLPLSEKQIQVSYAEYSKKMMSMYPPVFNATVLDPLVTYAPNNTKGLAFYFGPCQESLSKLITQNKLLQVAHSNIVSTTRGVNQHTLANVLAENSTVLPNGPARLRMK